VTQRKPNPPNSVIRPEVDPLGKFHRSSQGGISHEDREAAPTSESLLTSSKQSPDLFPPTPTPSCLAPDTSQSRGLKGYLDYFYYSPADVTGAFPAPYQLVLDVAARWSGVTTEDVNRVVAKYERTILKIRSNKEDTIDNQDDSEMELSDQGV